MTSSTTTRSLADLIVVRGVHVDDLAARVGVRKSQLYRFRAGKAVLREEQVVALAKGLGVTVSVLRAAVEETARRKSLRDEIGE